MDMKNLKKRLDKGARYCWAKENPTSYRLINAVTLKTAAGCQSRIDALKLTRYLKSQNYHVAAPAGEVEIGKFLAIGGKND